MEFELYPMLREVQAIDCMKCIKCIYKLYLSGLSRRALRRFEKIYLARTEEGDDLP